MLLIRIPGVYGPCRDSELLARAVRTRVRDGDSVLDVFTGSGVLAVAAAKAGAGEVSAVDIGRRAVMAARVNAALNGVSVVARRGSMFDPFRGRKFDLIIANPPFVPSIRAEAVRGAARAWEGGRDGRRLLDPLLAGVSDHLKPGGRVLVAHSSLCDVSRTIAALAVRGIEGETVIEETAPLGPITAPRAEALELLGLLAPGERIETTIVIEGVKQGAAVDDALLSAVPMTLARA